MKSINTYLMFDGQSKNAMEFYHNCFGGNLDLMTYRDMPKEENIPLPDEYLDKIMHATLIIEDIVIMASDQMPGYQSKYGDNVHLSINCDSAEEQKEIFEKLSMGGEVRMPLQNTFWGATFGQIKDRFGINWMLNFDTQNK